MSFYNYILYSESFDLYYKGFTEDFIRRLDEHNSGKGRYSDGKGTWKLVYLKECPSGIEALNEECCLLLLSKDTMTL
jgi:putative endonuclease